MGLHYKVYLIDDVLVKKDGGRADQLSSQPGLDKYRVLAIRKFLNQPESEPYRERAREILIKKSKIYSQGCRKRGKHNEAEKFERFAEQARRNLSNSNREPSEQDHL